MKIAYLILAHKEPAQLRRLTDRLVGSGDVYIHLDQKTDFKAFCDRFGAHPRVYISQRFKVWWAGFSMIKAYMHLFEAAYSAPEGYDRFVLMTGQDYPLMTSEEIVVEFEKNPETEYVMAYNLATSTVPTDKNKVLKRWYLDVPVFSSALWAKLWHGISYRVLTKPWTGRRLSVPLGGKMVDPYFGQMLSSFTRQGVELLLRTYKTDKAFNRKMKRVFAQVELYWQTVIFNSNLREKTVQGGKEHEITEHFGWAPHHYHNYDVDTSVYTEEDFEQLKNCGYMFCRKVVPGVSDGLMDKIDGWLNEKENIARSK